MPGVPLRLHLLPAGITSVCLPLMLSLLPWVNRGFSRPTSSLSKSCSGSSKWLQAIPQKDSRMPRGDGAAPGRERPRPLRKQSRSRCCLPCLNYDFLFVLSRKQNVPRGRLMPAMAFAQVPPCAGSSGPGGEARCFGCRRAYGARCPLCGVIHPPCSRPGVAGAFLHGHFLAGLLQREHRYELLPAVISQAVSASASCGLSQREILLG